MERGEGHLGSEEVEKLLYSRGLVSLSIRPAMETVCHSGIFKWLIYATSFFHPVTLYRDFIVQYRPENIRRKAPKFYCSQH